MPDRITTADTSSPSGDTSHRAENSTRWPPAAACGLIHDALLDYDGPPLPAAGHGDEVGEMLGAVENSADVLLLRKLASRQSNGDGQALHGDAHLGNCLASSGGMLWHDPRSSCRGPRGDNL